MIKDTIYKKSIFIKTFITLVFIITSVLHTYSQVDFTQRTSSKAPAPYTGLANYNLQGDFTMIGNTNLTLVNYSDNGGNNVNMRFVDIDGDGTTLNSSSAQLNIPGGECTEIVYAGLYWTGRAQTSSGVANTFTSVRTFGHNDYVEANAAVTMTRQGTANSYYPRYSITVGSNTVHIDFTNNTGNNRVQYRIGTTGAFTDISATYSSSGNTGTATFNSPLTLTIGGQQITITGLQRDSRTNRTEAQYQSTSYIIQQTELDKRKVKLKKDNLNYIDIEANNVNSTPEILFPTTNYDYIYAAYADITDYVREYGAGNYFVGDIALVEGNGGSVGYIGGWGMVIIYKNTSMKWRDITVFDGYGYMNSALGSKELPVSGFKAAQNGAVNVKLGMMAAEGDVNINGDYFNIINAAGNWRRVNKEDGSTGNTTGTVNFFNSAIMTGGNTRNPELVNNTGIDIVMFDLDNPWDAANNRYSIIPNNTTSTTFQFGSNQDVYSIFNIVFAVDAYVPEVVGENTPGNVGTVHGSTLTPGQDLAFDLKIYNKGEEAVNNMKVEIPIPFNLHYDPAAIIEVGTGAVNIPNNSTVTWIPPDGVPSDATPQNTPGGKLVWDIGTLPYDATKSILQGTLKYKLKVTENCALLATAGPCGLQVKINGRITGTGATSGTVISSDLVRDYGSGVCVGPVYEDFESTIEVGETFIEACGLPIENNRLQFKGFCSLPGNVFPRTDIANIYPITTKFFSSPPTSYESTTNVITGDFSVAPTGTKTVYYAMVQGMDPGCYIVLETSIEEVTTSPEANNVVFCFDETVVLNVELSTVGNSNDYQLYYFENQDTTTPLGTTPAPTEAGTYTYWVAEGKTQGGILCTGPKVSFTVTINEIPMVQQDLENVSICENNNTQFTVTATGATSYIWEYATAALPTVWVEFTNHNSINTVDGTLNISHAPQSINGYKIRLKVENDNGCESLSNEFTIEIKDCRVITNPMLPNKANK